MNSSKYILQIDNPCTQNLSGMEKTDAGRFCTHCSKAVIDFTMLTDQEIVKVFQKQSGRICGTLTNQQLSRVISDPTNHRNMPSLWKVFVGFLFIAVSEGSFANKNSMIQQRVSSFERKNIQMFSLKGDVGNDTIRCIISGQVCDGHSRQPIPYASIKLKDRGKAWSADAQGNFKIEISDSLMMDVVVLQITAVGYDLNQTSISRGDFPTNTNIFMRQNDNALSGDIKIIKKRKWWQFWQ